MTTIETMPHKALRRLMKAKCPKRSFKFSDENITVKFLDSTESVSLRTARIKE